MSNQLYPSRFTAKDDYIEVLEKHLESYKQEIVVLRKRIKMLEEEKARLHGPNGGECCAKPA